MPVTPSWTQSESSPGLILTESASSWVSVRQWANSENETRRMTRTVLPQYPRARQLTSPRASAATGPGPRPKGNPATGCSGPQPRQAVRARGAASLNPGLPEPRPSSCRRWPEHGGGRRFAAALLPRLFGTNPRSHHKGTTGRVRTGDQRLPVLCRC